MIYLVVALTALSAGLLVAGIASITPGPSRAVRQRLAQLQTDPVTYREVKERQRRQAQRQRIQSLLEAVGTTVKRAEQPEASETRKWLVYAGYRHPNAQAVFFGARLLLAGAMGLGAFPAMVALGQEATIVFLVTVVGALGGWMLPFVIVNWRVKRRQLEIRRALPDTVDLLVVCVEAGLGLNQALLRVAQEVDRVCPALSDELTVVNLEIRAGSPREDAFRNLAARTGLDDVRSLTSMLIQTDRFGTSVADSLRIHAETLRTKRMQQAEEKAAKLTVKLLFPLVLFIFPAIFVVILGPSFFAFRELFGLM